MKCCNSKCKLGMAESWRLNRGRNLEYFGCVRICFELKNSEETLICVYSALCEVVWMLEKFSLMVENVKFGKGNILGLVAWMMLVYKVTRYVKLFMKRE